jgi:hypothetical protein
MCKGFGMIIGKDMAAYFCEPDSDGGVSHSEILRRLGWKENTDARLRAFVRVECSDWSIKTFRFDEGGTLPGWAEENRDEIVGLVKKALRRAAPAWAEYEKVRDAAWAEYEKVRVPAWDEYEKVRVPAWAEYRKVRVPAWAEYEKVRDAAWARLIKRLSLISGYVPESE